MSADWLELIEKLALPAAVGTGLIVAAELGIGRFNNALKVSVSARRQAARGAEGLDDLVLVVGLGKEAPTRVRLERCVVTATLRGPDGAGYDEAADVLAAGLQRSLDADLLSSDCPIALTPGDAVTYEAWGRVPTDTTVHLKVALSGRQLVLERLAVGRPSWSSSVVSLPLASEAAPGSAG